MDSVEDDKTGSWFYNKDGNERAILLSIQRQPGTNTVEVAESVKKLLPVFRTELPPSVKMNVFYDRSQTIKESYDDVKFTMMLTLGLVIMVIFIFLRNFSATLIPSLALAVLRYRNVRGDAPAGLFAGQPFDDGLDPGSRLRGG